MKAVVLHHNLNNVGGEASLAINTIESLYKIGYDVDLVTIQKPDLEMIAKNYGKRLTLENVRCLFPFKISYLGIYQRLLLATPMHLDFGDADIVINTNGEYLPYNIPQSTTCILYVHFPVSLMASSKYRNNKYNQSKLWKAYFLPYQNMANRLANRALKRADIILANSKFTKNALAEINPGLKSHILYPPVDIERFSNAYHSTFREKKVLVISRFSPEKQLDKIVSLARMVQTNIQFQVIGLVTPMNRQYFNYILERIRDKGLHDKILLTPNATNEEIIEAMSSSSAYFHTMEGEHFGVSIIEAMAAGLIPIVPSYGGCSEIVPVKYHYNTIKEAADKISKAFSEFSNEKIEYFHDFAQYFSLPSFTRKLQQLLIPAFENKRKLYAGKFNR
jgi:alpha-1,2-mannosyltransferase